MNIKVASYIIAQVFLKKKNTPTVFKMRQIVFIVQIQANFIHATSSSFPGGEVSCIGHCIYTTLALQKSLLGVTTTIIGSTSPVAWMDVSMSIIAGVSSTLLTAAAIFLAEMLYILCTILNRGPGE